MKYLFFLSLFLVVAKGCRDKKVDGVIMADYGEEITLKLGEAMKLAGGDKQGFLFSSVENDSRCPKGVSCIQAGSATILVEEMNVTPKQVNIPADARGKTSFSIQGAKIIILSLNPYPVQGEKITMEDYRLVLRVEEGAPKL
ncbi:MAG: hypothetical protein AAFQ37_02300 [Bacteroidota bacterium]